MAVKEIIYPRTVANSHPELAEGPRFVKPTITPLSKCLSGIKRIEASKKVGVRVFAIFCVLFFYIKVTAQEFLPIWEKGKIPNQKFTIPDSVADERAWKVGVPGVYAFPANKAENTGTSILICPGGGYQRASYVYNGFNFARWFNTLGINVFVLVYRLPHQANLKEPAIAPLQDAQRAVKYIRANATAWKIDTGRLGVMGISAGGHLAAMLATQTSDVSKVNDGLDMTDHHPDFSVLLSPVITMGVWSHKGSRGNLLGSDTSATRLEQYSMEKQVTAATPPSFLVHAVNDKTVNVHNSLLYYNALIDHHVNASLHTFPQGGHGIRVTENPGSTELWLPLLQSWLKEMNFLKPIPFK
ncbi:alpha/beta hydrolase [Niabella yanshanensis]|uniref:Alpha/beta hydrolase n=1 Tax=Niabella yanshanensis TaxID=577386 RepID=A0ABZ0W2R4_9BACT|nr:alpha/beta hydrolase [Niabella yanshanensis]WQD36386.1 alpha/beta hydrolase [Niabella yanshanensis]